MAEVIEQSRTPATSLDVKALGELAAARAHQADRDRRLSDEVFDGIRAAGFPRHFVAARWGGREGGFAECLEAVEALSRRDASTGWCAALSATLGRMAAYLPEPGQRQVWAEGPDTFVVGALVPSGQAVPDGEGWLLSGRWPYVSGVHAADCALLSCIVPLADGRREPRFLLVPRAAYRVEQTWDTVGMRGTGSETVVLDPTFVPTEHSFPHADLVAGRRSPGVSACLNVPLRSVSGLTFAAPILGAVRGALDEWSAAVLRKRADPDATTALVLARSAGEADAAELLLTRVARDADLGLVHDEWAVARAQRDQVLAVELLLDAVNRLQRTAGTGGQSLTGQLQRFWRDANTAAGHAVLQWEPAARRFAEAEFGRLAETP
ncbi:hydrolase [Dactylosporangium roseum]|uniref:Hydrolase n=1 Tax=Dactylosporangium roseum TaxID=47989 RepID=A0ABY5ZCI0_9ACTN|nr:acyl-CoA dehydrogenase family protein [Dactylosporangium roseum]UWZ39364.1 hydrolase [Dactylosporangium roseum]